MIKYFIECICSAVNTWLADDGAWLSDESVGMCDSISDCRGVGTFTLAARAATTATTTTCYDQQTNEANEDYSKPFSCRETGKPKQRTFHGIPCQHSTRIWDIQSRLSKTTCLNLGLVSFIWVATEFIIRLIMA